MLTRHLRTPRSILQVPENALGAKTGRGPEDDREMSQRHLAVPEDDLKMLWVNQRIPPRYPPPRTT